MARQKQNSDKGTPGSTFKVGAIALAFLIIGYQSSLFIHRAAALHIASLQDAPDTVYVVDEALAARLLGSAAPLGNDGDSASGSSGTVSVRRNSAHSPAAEQVRRQTRRVESFRFNPNTVSLEDLVRLGFSEKQAQSIDNYRRKGGRFRRPSDFARSYVVSDSVFARLEHYITIPKTDINRADSAALDALPGIGPWFAARIIEYRQRLGGYSYKEQLLDIYNFDQEKYDGLSDLITCSRPLSPFRLWTLGEDSLRLHPYIRTRQAAHSIVLYRTSMPRDQWSVPALARAGILPEADASRLERCLIEEP